MSSNPPELVFRELLGVRDESATNPRNTSLLRETSQKLAAAFP